MGTGGDGSDFEKAMSDTKPLDDRDKGGASQDATPSPPRAGRRLRATVSFDLEQDGERVEGLAPGVDHGLLGKLRNGEIPWDARVDLHGLDEASARRRVHEVLLEARRQGNRCVLVIHGRGSHSPDGPVLKQALIDWLAEPPVGPNVLAFAPATGGDGGVGATYVLLRS